MLKYGKLPPKAHPKTLMFEKYLKDPDIPPPPIKTYWGYKVQPGQWGMLGNDTIGNCTVASIAHILMSATAHTGKMVAPTMDDVLKVYSAVSGYDPKTGLNDNGAYITDVLNYWQTVGIAGHKIAGWAKIPEKNLLRVHQAIWLFSALDCGFVMPLSAMLQFNSGMAWHHDDNNTDVDGAHCVPLFNYGQLGLTGVTWAQLQQLTNQWFLEQCDEAYAVIMNEWVNDAGDAPNHLKMDELIADLKQIAA